MPIPEEIGNRRRPPLWQSKSAKASTARVVAIVLGTTISALILFAVAFERDLLSVPMGQAEVVVIRIQDDKPQGKLNPAWFRYLVALPDGTKATFVSDRMQRPGSRLVVTMSRGRVSRRVWLSGPYRLTAEPSGARE
jgi:hypothetical protein